MDWFPGKAGNIQGTAGQAKGGRAGYKQITDRCCTGELGGPASNLPRTCRQVKKGRGRKVKSVIPPPSIHACLNRSQNAPPPWTFPLTYLE